MYEPNESKYLLHVCCAPCASAAVERLLQRGEQVVLFFSNSNIYPFDEYQKRLLEVHKLARRHTIEVVEDVYDHVSWLEAVAGFEQEPEKGSRCTLCFGYNLARTYGAARRLGIPRFSTTLSVSPHKNSRQIFTAAESFDGFVEDDFKKQNGYARSIELSKAYGLYRQCYCGCEFSMR